MLFFLEMIWSINGYFPGVEGTLGFSPFLCSLFSVSVV